MRRHRTLKRTQHQHAAADRRWSRLQHVEADPVVLQHPVVQDLHDFPHEVFHRTRRLTDAIDLLLDFRDFWDRGHGRLEFIAVWESVDLAARIF